MSWFAAAYGAWRASMSRTERSCQLASKPAPNPASSPTEERATLKRALGLGRGPVVLSPRSLMPVYNPRTILDAFGLLGSPYAGLFGFIVVPAFFILGLLLIPIGMWREGRRRRPPTGRKPVTCLRPKWRRRSPNFRRTGRTPA